MTRIDDNHKGIKPHWKITTMDYKTNCSCFQWHMRKGKMTSVRLIQWKITFKKSNFNEGLSKEEAPSGRWS